MRDSVATELTGFASDGPNYEIRVEHRASGTGVRQTSDREMSKLVLWSVRNTVCPEAYINLSVAPGEQTRWTINYEFYNVPK